MTEPWELADIHFSPAPEDYPETGACKEYAEHCQREALKPLFSEAEYDTAMARVRELGRQPDVDAGEWVDADYAVARMGEAFEFQSRPGRRYTLINGALLCLDANGGVPMQAYFSKHKSLIRFTGERVRFVIEPAT